MTTNSETNTIQAYKNTVCWGGRDVSTLGLLQPESAARVTITKNCKNEMYVRRLVCARAR